MSTLELTQQELLVGGRWRPASDDLTFSRVDPFTGHDASVAAAACAEDARRACDAAAAAFPAWSTTSPAERRTLLMAAADNLEARSQEIVEAVASEIGGTFGWAMFNCQLAAGMLREAAAQTYAGTSTTIPSDTPGLRSMAVRQPAGVVLAMAPWNAPVILATRSVATPLAYGNTVVMKGSEFCPRVHGLVVRAINDAGLPDGVINYISHSATDGPDVVAALVSHKRVRRVNFTGSSRVGKVIAHLCSENLKPSLLELGGKAPLVVLDDADLDEVAAAATFGAFMNAGQICMSTERIIADRQVVAELEQKLVERATGLVCGDPRDPETAIGPVIDDTSRARVLGMIEDARDRGARVLCGGNAAANVIKPTVIADATREMRLYTDESFGPVVSIVPVDGVEQAIEIANDSDYGLSAAVFGRDVERALMVAGQLDTGICHVNSATVQDEPQIPFGGVKDSGWGRFGSDWSLEHFTETRWVTVQSGTRHYPI